MGYGYRNNVGHPGVCRTPMLSTEATMYGNPLFLEGRDFVSRESTGFNVVINDSSPVIDGETSLSGQHCKTVNHWYTSKRSYKFNSEPCTHSESRIGFLQDVDEFL